MFIPLTPRTSPLTLFQEHFHFTTPEYSVRLFKKSGALRERTLQQVGLVP
jgi:hypothetical protein